MQSNLTKIFETGWAVVYGRRASIPELVVLPARSGDLVETPYKFRTSRDMDSPRNEYVPGANRRASRCRNVLKGNVHFVGRKTCETDPVGVGTVATRLKWGS